MQLDFWNNPIVVSAFRVKYRRGGLFMTSISYLVLLAAGGIGLMYWSHAEELNGNPWKTPWHEVYLLILLSVQLGFSGLIAATTTATSMRAEVMNRTLDFQRIAAISPRQILIGKLFGEAALAYLMAIAIFPLAFLCMLLHIPGLDPLTFLLLFVNLYTSIIMMGSFGLLQKLVIPAGKTSAGGGNAGIAIIVMMGMFIPQLLMAGGPGWLDKPWTGGPVGLLTPIPALVGLFHHDPWRYGLSLFEVHMPFLVVTPLSQLVIAWLCVHTMERRLVNPVTPPMGKREAYLTLLLLDLLIAGIVYGNGVYRWPLTIRVAAFCAIHMVLSFWLMICVTPGREVLESWIWRWRGRRPLVVDWWIGDRTENCLVLLTFGVIGIAFAWLGVALPGWSSGSPGDYKILLAATGVSFLLLLAFGTLHQWVMLLAPRQGVPVFFLLAFMLNAIPAILGGIWFSSMTGGGNQIETLYNESNNISPLIAMPTKLAFDITPGAHFVHWLGGNTPAPNLLPLLVVYVLLLIGVWLLVRKRVARTENMVDRKLEAMGVRTAPVHT